MGRRHLHSIIISNDYELFRRAKMRYFVKSLYIRMLLITK
nr:MAG TPA: hypothetical protein [Caudoviricetes sp.]DAQ23060.1 MAG TPA: hypothetical protein [Bacteriophage sp.]